MRRSQEDFIQPLATQQNFVQTGTYRYGTNPTKRLEKYYKSVYSLVKKSDEANIRNVGFRPVSSKAHRIKPKTLLADDIIIYRSIKDQLVTNHAPKAPKFHAWVHNPSQLYRTLANEPRDPFKNYDPYILTQNVGVYRDERKEDGEIKEKLDKIMGLLEKNEGANSENRRIDDERKDREREERKRREDEERRSREDEEKRRREEEKRRLEDEERKRREIEDKLRREELEKLREKERNFERKMKEHREAMFKLGVNLSDVERNEPKLFNETLPLLEDSNYLGAAIKIKGHKLSPTSQIPIDSKILTHVLNTTPDLPEVVKTLLKS